MFDSDVVSDLHKDAYGFRPREGFWNDWHAADDAGKQAIWDDLISAADADIERERAEQKLAIQDLEDRFNFMQATIVGCTREDAIRYLHDVYQTNGDVNYLEWNLGVPYGYLSGKNLG